MRFEDIIINLSEIPEKELNLDSLKKIKREFSKINKLPNLPTNIQLIRTYKSMLAKWEIKKSIKIEKILKKRSVRSMSGIVPIQVLTEPYPCPWKCIFCPNDISMPKSYINTEPWAMRALLNQFDPIKQVYNRLLSLTITGHDTDKIEMIVLWGSWDAYPQDYKIKFIKWLYDACNTFDQFYDDVDIDHDNPKSAKYTFDSNLIYKFADDFEIALQINETSSHRIIGLTIETRPEFVTDKNCLSRRQLWVTRVEIWIQNLFDDVLEANQRWHTTAMVREAMHRLRQYWFKISTHFMPWLYKSTLDKDIQTIKIAYQDPFIKPDEIKYYPTSVIPNTQLYDYYKQWKYLPLTIQDIKYVTEQIKEKYIPPYTRIKRLVRDIPSSEIVAWSDITNLRQIIQTEMQLTTWLIYRLYDNLKIVESLDEVYEFIVNKTVHNEIQTLILWWSPDFSSQRNFICLCTRCREVKNKYVNMDLPSTESTHVYQELLVIRRYRTSNWEELFISFEDQLGYLYWFARLLLPSEEETVDIDWLWKFTSIIRELHIYGQMAKIESDDLNFLSDKSQHKWLGSRLMELAEKISITKWYHKISVISWIWVRWFYKKIWYSLEWTYMVKKFLK